MAREQLTAPPGARWSHLPAWLRIGILYLAARAVTTVLLVVAADLSGFDSRFGPDATIKDLVLGWDARWYWIVAETGYPDTLPTTDDGRTAENQWAFMPLYAYLAKAVSLPFGGDWAIGAFLVSITAGYGASYALYRMLRERIDVASATWATVFFAAGPLSALFQVGYAEPLFLLWLFLALWCVQRRRYGWVYLLVPLMGYTRPGVLAFALFLGLYGIWRWFRRRREPLGVGEIIHIVALGAVAVIVGFSWQFIVGAVTGDPGAYLATELSWRRNWIAGEAVFFPLEGFISAAGFWFGSIWGLTAEVGYVVLALVVAGLSAVLLFEPHVRRLGVEVRLWSASYLVYLLLVFFPQSSVFRLLLPVSPLWGAVATVRSAWWRVGVLIACVAGQWWWIHEMYALGNTFWRVP